MSGPQLQDVISTVRIPVFQPSSYNAGKFRTGTNDVNRNYLNCFPVIHGKGSPAGQEGWLEKRSPFSCSATDLSGILGAVNSNCYYNICVTQLNDVNVAAIWDNTNSKFVIVQYRTFTGTSTKIGELTGAAATDEIFLSELSIGGVATLGVVYHKNDYTNSKAYFATSVGGVFPAASLTQIVDVDFPSNLGTPDHITGPFIQMNTITYIMGRSGAVYGSDNGSITSWNSLNKVQATQYPDLGCGLCRYKNLIVAFGDDSTEFFHDVGNPGPSSVLQRLDQAFIKFGCVHPRSFMNIDDTLYWIAKSSSGTNGIWKLSGGYTPVKISGQAEDATISVMVGNIINGPHMARIWPYVSAGRKHIIIGNSSFAGSLGMFTGQTFPGDINSLGGLNVLSPNLCMTIDDEEFWGFKSIISVNSFYPLMALDSLTARNSNDMCWPGAYVTTNTTTIGQNIFGQSGQITNSSQGNKDFGSAADVTGSFIPVGFQLSGIDFGNDHMKRINRMSLIQRGLNTGGFSATLWFGWNKNNNTTGINVSDVMPSSTNMRSITVPNFTNRWHVTNLGMARVWVFGIIILTENAIAFKELEFEIEQLTR